MNRTHPPTFLTLTLAVLAALVALTPAIAQDSSYEVSIDVAPAILNLENSGSVVTVHANILYAEVASAELYIGADAIQSWRMDEDNQGYFVANFTMLDIKTAVLENQTNTFVLIGIDQDNFQFWGEQVVMVIGGDEDTNESKKKSGVRKGKDE